MLELTETHSLAVSDSLVYEELNGNPLYRRGYKEVLINQKTVEDIMGNSSLQAFIVSILFAEISRLLPDNLLAFTSESGLHLGPGDNISNDIAIFQTADLRKVDEFYFSVLPKIVVEVDVKIDFAKDNFTSPADYVNIKTQKMLDFGVEKVIWITTAAASRKILIAETNSDWRLTHWRSEIDFAPNCRFSLQGLIETRG